MMYIYATETFEVDRVIDRFANAKKRRLLLLVSRSVGMKLKFDRNIIAIIKLLVFKELPPFESSGYIPGRAYCGLMDWQMKIVCHFYKLNIVISSVSLSVTGVRLTRK